MLIVDISYKEVLMFTLKITIISMLAAFALKLTTDVCTSLDLDHTQNRPAKAAATGIRGEVEFHGRAKC